MTADDRPDGGPPLIALPHTGLRVPHTRLRVTGYREIRTPGGVAFIAALHHAAQRVGTVANAGYGGGTRLQNTYVRVFTGRDLRAYAAAARTPRGHAATEEEVLDALVMEATTDGFVAGCVRGRLTALRQVGYIDPADPTYLAVGHTAAGGTPEYLPLHTDADTGRWWQAWNGRTWRDLTRRPDR
jgi:hypothetical protein